MDYLNSERYKLEKEIYEINGEIKNQKKKIKRCKFIL